MASRPLAAAVVLALSLTPGRLVARQVAGTVVDGASGEAIASALVQLLGADSTVLATTFTDERGGFALGAAATPVHWLFVSRLDYRSARVALRDLDGPLTALRIPLDVQPVALSGVAATAESRNRWLASSGFYDRQKLGFGRFVTREMLDGKYAAATRASEVLRQVPGVLRVEDKTFSYTILYMRAPMMNVDTSGGAPKPCPAVFYVNGMYQGPSLDRMSTDDIEAIEVYRGPAEIPPQYGGAYAACGVVLIWLRTG